MVPKVAAKGRSFKGAGLYYLHDKKAETAERVAFTYTENLPTDDAEKAIRLMAYTAMHQNEIKAANGGSKAGRKLTASVLTYSLSWSPDEAPTAEQMIAAGRETLKALGMADHQAVMVAHNDEPHPHLHVIANRVHPETGKAATLSNDHLRLSEWAERYEKKHGKIRCEARVANNAERRSRKEKGQSGFVKHRPEMTPADYHAERKARLRLAFDRRQIESKNLSATHTGQRQALYDAKEERIKQRRAEIRELNRPQWAALYRRQQAEQREMKTAQASALSRLRYWLQNRQQDRYAGPQTERRGMLSEALRVMTGRQDHAAELAARHEVERAGLSQQVRQQSRDALREINKAYRYDLEKLKQMQGQERGDLAERHSAESQEAARAIRDEGRAANAATTAREEFGEKVSDRVKRRREQREQQRRQRGDRPGPGRDREP